MKYQKMKRIKEVMVVISLLYITIGNVQTNKKIAVKEILGVLGKNYTIEKYKSHTRNKEYLTLQVFVDSIHEKELYIVYINGDSFWIKKKESVTFLVNHRQIYEVGASAFVRGILKIPNIIPRKRDSLVIKAYLKTPPKVTPRPKYGKIAVLGEEYTMDTYKSQDKKTYLTFQVFEFGRQIEDFFVSINEEDTDHIEGKNAATYMIRAKRNYDVELSNYFMETIRIPYIFPQERDSLVIKGYLKVPIKVY